MGQREYNPLLPAAKRGCVRDSLYPEIIQEIVKKTLCISSNKIIIKLYIFS